MQTELRFPQSSYSDWVMRNSLYWMSPVTEWTLDSDKDDWIVHLSNSDFGCKAQLHRYLNDYTLREKIMAKTAAVRDAITFNVLSSIERRLDTE
jgi:His-Xaa-Ser system protein HxsD